MLMKSIQGELVPVESVCPKCGDHFFYRMTSEDAADEAWKRTLLKGVLCPKCLALDAKAEQEAKRKAEEAERQRKMDLTYEARREFSRIDEYYMGFDVNHPDANRTLFDWMGEHQQRSILLTDETGTGKTRIMQYYAMELLRTKSVYYAGSADLCDRLAAMFSKKVELGERFLHQLYAVDLLIIDDLGKEGFTESRKARLWQLIDARYSATEQKKLREEGRYCPLWDKPQQTRRGWQLWISTNFDASELIQRLGQLDGDPTVRRLIETMEQAPKKRGNNRTIEQ